MALLAPVIANEGNICCASSAVHLMTNQKVFGDVLGNAMLEHLPSCGECSQGSFIQHSDTVTLSGRSGSGHQCIIGALEDLKRAYNYRFRPSVVLSSSLIFSLSGKNVLAIIGKISAICCYFCADENWCMYSRMHYESLLFLVKCLVKTLPKR